MLHAPACALLVHKVFGVEGKVQGVTGPALWGTGPLALPPFGLCACFAHPMGQLHAVKDCQPGRSCGRSCMMCRCATVYIT